MSTRWSHDAVGMTVSVEKLLCASINDCMVVSMHGDTSRRSLTQMLDDTGWWDVWKENSSKK